MLDSTRTPDTERLWRARLELEEKLRLRQGRETDFHTPAAQFRAELLTRMLKGFGLYERGRRNACRPRWTDLSFAFPALPEVLDGFRIVQLSDFHFLTGDTRFLEAIHALLEKVETDLCVLTGDYRFGYYGSQEHVREQVRGVLAGVQARYGFYGILGNHDLSDIVAPLRELGIHMLVNQGMLAPAPGAPLWIAGVDDPHKFRSDSVDAALAGAPEDAFKLFLAHSPECIAQAAARGVNLYLCGHTHGGQVRLPLIGPLFLNARCRRAYAGGRWRFGAMSGYTTYGLGTTDLPVRYYCPPEAVRITLRKG